MLALWLDRILVFILDSCCTICLVKLGSFAQPCPFFVCPKLRLSGPQHIGTRILLYLI